MKPSSDSLCYPWLMLVTFYLAFGLVPDAVAADGGDSWRATYDLIMRWVNFIILAAVIVKFGRRPLMNFLTGRKEEIAYELRRLEEEKQAVLHKVGEMRRQIEESESRFEQIRERIIRQGRSRKQALIEEAHRESRMLMESARNHIDNRLRQAKRKLRAEIIDLAADKAIQKLPDEITEEDNRMLVEKYLQRAES